MRMEGKAERLVLLAMKKPEPLRIHGETNLLVEKEPRPARNVSRRRQ
jgi:hypothetical protein